ncbi:MAG: hypothetical protein J7545_06805 [Roseofilum sp. SBFL]|uniref:hypothetical protein n=1 Tax=unclassified Roseofilum TaxID=2620099 RepID=UPI001B077871|nr:MULTISPECIES: hypothetical protein [unclassified Roseofilum]MBP0013802.1 hypothetical protein [Roseofilum sp. SID3]MBP0025605.1 hypothetical protein [Roseofilum sp. SID2]MBP0041667.1 hypothetical protein [Roseofilum sp. SBFL]
MPQRSPAADNLSPSRKKLFTVGVQRDCWLVDWVVRLSNRLHPNVKLSKITGTAAFVYRSTLQHFYLPRPFFCPVLSSW